MQRAQAGTEALRAEVHHRVDRRGRLCLVSACGLQRNFVGFQPLRVNNGFEARSPFLQFVVQPQINRKTVYAMVETETGRKRDALLGKPGEASAPVRADRNAIEGNAQIVSHHLELLVVLAIEPRKLGVARKEVGPAFKGVGRNDTKLGDLFHDRRAGIRREDICPEFGTGKFSTDIHDEANGLSSFFFAFAGKGKDDVERWAKTSLDAA